MIYLEQTFDIQPASPAGLDRFVELAQSELLPGWERVGGRLVGAWFGVEDWFYQVRHVVAFADLAAFESARRAGSEDAAFAAGRAAAEKLAPERHETLLEPFGPVAPERLDQAIAAAADEARGVYSMAILDVLAGRMEEFRALLSAGVANLPIIASWRDVAGNPDRVIDLWEGDPSGRPYRPSNPAMEAFFGPLREVAPKERTVRIFPLPYSPLR